MIEYARLFDGKVIPCTMMEWASGQGRDPNRFIARTILHRRRRIYVSTIFLGMNHGWFGTTEWFETMVFGTSMNGYCCRYATLEQARRGHKELVHRARQARWTPCREQTLRFRRRQLRQMNRFYRTRRFA